MKTGVLMPLLLAFSLAGGAVHGQTALSKSTGQNLYLPIYSHIWHGNLHKGGQPTKTLMSISVSIRNTDQVRPIKLTLASYYDTDGKKIKDYISSAKVILPMATYELFVPLDDDAGGSGANFVISWQADQESSQPVVEAIHANLPAGRSVVFTTSAYVLPLK